MKIIIFTNKDDLSSTKIIEWLNFLQVPNLRINTPFEDFGCSITFTSNVPSLQFSNSNYYISQDDIIFYRRVKSVVRYKVPHNIHEFTLEYVYKTIDHLNTEAADLNYFVFNQLKKKSINTPHNSKVNKLELLCAAQSVGLATPKTIITNNKIDLINFFDKTEIICKPISDNLSFEFKNFSHSSLPYVFHYDNIEDVLPVRFGYSLFQEYYSCKFEIRVFIFGSIIKSIGILKNTNNENTDNNLAKSIESKNGIKNNLFPVELPIDIRKKLFKLLKNQKLITGSVDLLYLNDGKYVFLEVNPVGQFDYVSYYGNFYLEKEIAMYLKNEYFI